MSEQLPPPVANGFNEWASIEFPAFLRDLGFEDYSYHNDTCARAVKPLAGYTEEEGYPCIEVWCEHEKPEDREYIDWPNTNSPRFHAQLHTVADPCSDNYPVTIYSGDDAKACEAALLALHGRVGGASDDGADLGTIVEMGDGVMWVVFDDAEWRSDERPDGAVRFFRDKDGSWVKDDMSGGAVVLEVK